MRVIDQGVDGRTSILSFKTDRGVSCPTVKLAVETKARTRVECIPGMPVLIPEIAVPLGSRVPRFASFRLGRDSGRVSCSR